MRNTLILLVSVFILFSCKKNNTSAVTQTQIDVIGTWTLFSLSIKPDAGNATVYSADKFPCLAGNKIKFISGGTMEGSYIRTDTCIIQMANGDSFIDGFPGRGITNSTFTQNANTVIIQSSGGTSNGVLSTSGGRLILTNVFVSQTNATITGIYYKD